ncbi:DUF3093 domain-containing protein [Humibacter ginsenosidimutans]|uniref:DUF3093 domain-containing protein n=1 Tax=Humibacter ginsenosidimutans TaxID=2599293 RepID=A0A5B8M0U2_9MICO|nr:DUF3093 domain-containing protein [Humibacter ginsenosidimutans]QDZ13876.1 DUF3093 domain-containing protein [Humibacter ginsenosidimutans]
MYVYRERLWAAPWLFVATALVIPASIIVFAPINMLAGIICAIVLYAGCVIGLIAGSPTIELTADELRAGRAQIERRYLGIAESFDGTEASLQRGRLLDARAWLLIRGWATAVVRVPILDRDDPTPYWLLSTRHPTELARALNDRAGDNLPPAPHS